MNSINALRSTRQGKCYVLGNSGSLSRIRTEELLASVPTIGVNRILRVVSGAVSHLLIADKMVLQSELLRVNSCATGLLIFGGLDSRVLRQVERPERIWTWGIHTCPYQRKPPRGHPPKLGEFRFSGNTGTYAIEAAALMGFSDIRMLGIDLTNYGTPTSHCWGDGRTEGCRLSRPLPYLVERYRMVFEELKSRNVKLVNESPVEGPLDAVIPKETCPWLLKK